MNNMPEIAKSNDSCCGCGACVNICPVDAITMKDDKYGFHYPCVNVDLCINCKKCERVCDFVKTEKVGVTPIKAYAAVHKSSSILAKSSSGGVFSALAEYALSKKGAVCGCVLDESLNALHICVEEEKDLISMRKSKYLQSEIGLVYREIKERLEQKQFVFFTGTPCQVAALKSFLAPGEYDNLLTMDLICHGVPSQQMFNKYLEYLENKYKTKIVGFDFRSKRYGWQRSSTEFTDHMKKTKNLGKISEFYIPAFTGGNIVRPSCFSCKYACRQRVGDITAGDFWGQEKSHLSLDVKKGLSLCMINTPKAQSLLPELHQRLHLEEVDYNVAASGNYCLNAPTLRGQKWEEYMKAFENDRIPQIAKRYKKSHRKTILRSRLRQYVPINMFHFIRKIKYR